MKIAVLGGGAFGTALAIALSKDGSDVALWSRDREDAERMQGTRQSGKALPGLELPESLVCQGLQPLENTNTSTSTTQHVLDAFARCWLMNNCVTNNYV